MNRKVVVVIVIMLTLLVATQAYANKIGLDNFNLADQSVCDPTTACATSVTQSSVANASAIGGQRDVSVVRTSGTGNVSSATGVNSDLISYSQDAFTEGTWEVVWDGDSNPAILSYLLGADLTDTGLNDRFIFGGVTNDFGFTLRVEVYTDASNWAFIDSVQPALQTSVDVPILFSTFSTGAGVPDFANVGAVRISVNGAGIAALDLSIDYVTSDDATPTAVTLQNVGASDQSALFPLALGALLLVLFSAGLVYNHKRQAA